MKRTIFALTVTAGLMTTAFWGCDKHNADNPEISHVSVSDCHHPDPEMFSKSSDEDSVVVSWPRENGPMTVTHYNINLDCGSGEHIGTTVEMEGNVVTVTEHVGEQGLTDCFCFYDNTVTITNLPPSPFTLVIQVESLFMGITGNIPETTIVYQQQF